MGLHLREKNTAATISSVSSDEPDISAPLIVRCNADREWKPVGVPGMQYCILSFDEKSGRQTFLLRCEPSCVLLDEASRGIEECYVLEGDLLTHDVQLSAGDYIRFHAGTNHSVPPDRKRLPLADHFGRIGPKDPRGKVVRRTQIAGSAGGRLSSTAACQGEPASSGGG